MRIFAVGTKIFFWGGGLANIWPVLPPPGPNVEPPLTSRHRMTAHGNKTAKINVKNIHGSLTTVVRAHNYTSKTANITDTVPFSIEHW